MYKISTSNTVVAWTAVVQGDRQAGRECEGTLWKIRHHGGREQHSVSGWPRASIPDSESGCPISELVNKTVIQHREVMVPLVSLAVAGLAGVGKGI